MPLTQEELQNARQEKEHLVRMQALEQLQKFKCQLKDKDFFNVLLAENSVTADENDNDNEDEGMDYNVDQNDNNKATHGTKRNKQGYHPSITSVVGMYLK